LTEFKHLLVFDLTKLGAAYQIINSFVDDDVVQAFEVSPIGTKAVLILVSNDLITMKFIEKECSAFFNSDILNSILIENIQHEVIHAYLSQNVPTVMNHLAVIEETSFADAFRLSAAAAAKEIQIVDFRAIRTGTPNLVITLTDHSIERLNQLSASNRFTKFTVIEKVQKSLKSYFEILV
jgi:hypothetical protein